MTHNGSAACIGEELRRILLQSLEVTEIRWSQQVLGYTESDGLVQVRRCLEDLWETVRRVGLCKWLLGPVNC